MAQNRRVEKVSALIRKEMSELLMRGLRDHRLEESLITITDVEVSGDLQHCKIFVSIFDQETNKEQVMEALDSATGFLKGELGRRLQMRRAPDIVFKFDKGMEKGISVLKLLGRLEEERQGKDKTKKPIDE